MAAPFLFGLSLRARRASPIIKRGVREGVSSRQLAAVLQKSGLGIRRQTLLDLMRLAGDEAAIGPVLSALNLKSTPNPARLPVALTKIRRAFSFTVRVRGTVPKTGESITQMVTVTIGEPISREGLEALAEQAVLEGGGRYPFEITDVLLVGGLRSGAPGVL